MNQWIYCTCVLFWPHLRTLRSKSMDIQWHESGSETMHQQMLNACWRCPSASESCMSLRIKHTTLQALWLAVFIHALSHARINQDHQLTMHKILTARKQQVFFTCNLHLKCNLLLHKWKQTRWMLLAMPSGKLHHAVLEITAICTTSVGRVGHPHTPKSPGCTKGRMTKMQSCRRSRPITSSHRFSPAVWDLR